MYVYILNAMWKYFNAHLFVIHYWMALTYYCTRMHCMDVCSFLRMICCFFVLFVDIFMCMRGVCLCVHLFVLQALRIWMHWNNAHLISKFVCRRNVQHLHIIVRRLQVIERKIQNKMWKTVQEDPQRKQQY